MIDHGRVTFFMMLLFLSTYIAWALVDTARELIHWVLT